MQTQINIEIRPEDNTIVVKLPYLQSRITKFKAAGGKWSGSQDWIFPDCENTRNLLYEMFNWVEGCGLVECKLNYFTDVQDDGNSYTYKNYVLASRKGKNYRVQQPAGVILTKGSYPESGGSVKNPHPAVEPDSEGKVEYILTMFDGVAKNDSSVSVATDRIQKLIAELKRELIATGLDDGTGEYSSMLDTMTEKLRN